MAKLRLMNLSHQRAQALPLAQDEKANSVSSRGSTEAARAILTVCGTANATQAILNDALGQVRDVLYGISGDGA